MIYVKRCAAQKSYPKKNLYTFNISSVSKRVEGESVSVRVWQADEWSVRGDEVTAHWDGVLQAPVYQNLGATCSHPSSDKRFFICFEFRSSNICLTAFLSSHNALLQYHTQTLRSHGLHTVMKGLSSSEPPPSKVPGSFICSVIPRQLQYNSAKQVTFWFRWFFQCLLKDWLEISWLLQCIRNKYLVCSQFRLCDMSLPSHQQLHSY